MKFFPALIVFIFLLASCEKDEFHIPPEPETDTPFSFAGEITKAGSYTQAEIEEMLNSTGIYAFDANQSDAPVYSNQEFTYSNNILSPKSNPMYWQRTENLKVYAYVPYNAAHSNPEELSLSAGADQSSLANLKQSDFLYASRTGVTHTNWQDAGSTLTFSHRLSKIDINIKAGPDVEETDVANSTVAILNTFTQAKLNLKTNVLTPEGTATTIVPNTIGTPEAGYQKSFQAITMPQTIAAGTSLLKITFKGQNYEYKLADNFTLAAGTAYALNITLTRTEIILNVTETAWVNTDRVEGSERIQYAVGDYFPIPEDPSTAIGVVFQITDGIGYKGKVVSLNETEKKWLDIPKIQSDSPDCDSYSDGKHNVARAIAYKGIGTFPSRYPAFYWCYTYGAAWGEGTVWYLPARDELQEVREAYKDNTNNFKNKFVPAGGTAISNEYYYSSTEFVLSALAILMNGSGGGSPVTKQDPYKVRAIRTFGD